MSARNLHRLAGGLVARQREALKGVCSLASCDRPAAGFIQGWDLKPRGVCALHAPVAERLGYRVQVSENTR